MNVYLSPQKYEKTVHQKTAEHICSCASLLSPAFCIYLSGIATAISFLHLLGLLQWLLTSCGAILAQTPLCFFVLCRLIPKRPGVMRELQHSPVTSAKHVAFRKSCYNKKGIFMWHEHHPEKVQLS